MGLLEGNMFERSSARFALATTTLGVCVSLGVAPAQAVTAPVNLIGTYGTILADDGLMGLVGVPEHSSYSEYETGDTFSAGDLDCTGSWETYEILCDPEPTTNVSGELTVSSENIGFTFGVESAEDLAYIVIDLGQKMTFSSYEIFQMVDSDGNVTQTALEVSDELGETWPIESDDSWTTVVPLSDVNGPTTLTGSGPYTNTDVTIFNFDQTSGRYVKLLFANDGTLDNDSWIEVQGVKLFGNIADDELASTGVSFGLATTVNVGAGAILAGMALRRRSTLSFRR